MVFGCKFEHETTQITLQKQQRHGIINLVQFRGFSPKPQKYKVTKCERKGERIYQRSGATGEIWVPLRFPKFSGYFAQYISLSLTLYLSLGLSLSFSVGADTRTREEGTQERREGKEKRKRNWAPVVIYFSLNRSQTLQLLLKRYNVLIAIL